MKGLLIKDFLTIKKKYGVPRLIMDRTDDYFGRDWGNIY